MVSKLYYGYLANELEAWVIKYGKLAQEQAGFRAGIDLRHLDHLIPEYTHRFPATLHYNLYARTVDLKLAFISLDIH